jgi:hypothetical protein
VVNHETRRGHNKPNLTIVVHNPCTIGNILLLFFFLLVFPSSHFSSFHFSPFSLFPSFSLFSFLSPSLFSLLVYILPFFDFSFPNANDNATVAEFCRTILLGVETHYIKFYLRPPQKDLLMVATMLNPQFKSLLDISSKSLYFPSLSSLSSTLLFLILL